MDLVEKMGLYLEDEEKNILKYLRKNKGKPDEEMIRGLKKKFDLDDYEAEKALELRD